MRTRDERKEIIIRQKAVELIVNQGFDGLSMHKLAKASGVSPATIYIYFKDREDLIRQVSIEEELKMLDATLKGFDPEMPFDIGLKHQWTNRAGYFLQNPLRMYFMEQIRYSRFNDAVLQCGKENFVRKMSRFVHLSIKRGDLVKLPLEVYWSVAFAPLYQLVKFHINGKGIQGRSFDLDEDTLQQALDIVLKGLKP